MCGFAGFWNPGGGLSDPEECLARMAKAVAHRGPDDQQIYWDAGSGIGLGHRRLSIIDLSPEGRQPMVSDSGRYVLAYNGEVYNFGDLRVELKQTGAVFRGQSDTEVHGLRHGSSPSSVIRSIILWVIISLIFICPLIVLFLSV